MKREEKWENRGAERQRGKGTAERRCSWEVGATAAKLFEGWRLQPTEEKGFLGLGYFFRVFYGCWESEGIFFLSFSLVS